MNKAKRNSKHNILQQEATKTIILPMLVASLLTACGSGNGGGTTETSLDKPTTSVPTQPSKDNQQGGTVTPPKPPKITLIPNANFSAVGNSKIVTTPALVMTNVWHNDKTNKVAALSSYDKAEVLKVLQKTNEYRKEVGKKPLKWDENLAAYAQMRSQELVEQFSHTRPDGTGPNSGVILTSGSTGENIAAGQNDAEEVSLSWKNSSGHYKNMVSDNYDRIGIGLVRVADSSDKQGYHYYWTQTFGGGNATSPYDFDKSQAPKEPDMISLLGQRIELTPKHELSIKGGENITTNASRAYGKGQLRHPIYKKSLRFNGDGFYAIVQDPEAAGFTYQTFAEIVDSTKTGYYPIQYVNIGQPTAPNDITTFNATYKGAALGNVNQDSHYYSDVTAKITGNKMNIAFSNTRFNHSGNDVYTFTPSTLQGKDLNFSENMQWDSKNHQFVKDNSKNGDHIQAKFYGPNGEELGGQFKRAITNLGQYQGAFGAKKIISQ